MGKCTYVDGIGSSQAIDTAGEIVDIAGLDISSLVGGALNWEHKSDIPAQIVGKIVEAKKIFSEADCDNDRQKMFWNKCQLPFLYIVGRLFDDKKDSSREAAALFKDDAEHPNEQAIVGFSVEGAKIEKVGAVITRSIARKVTITNIPANKTCVAEMLPIAKKKDGKMDFDSLFKGELALFNFEPTYIEILEKKESLKKDAAPMPLPPETPEIQPTPIIGAGRTGMNMSEKLKKDVGSGGGAFIGDSLAMKEKDTKSMKKALEAGSGISAPGSRVGGVVLGVEHIEGSDSKNKTGKGIGEHNKITKSEKKQPSKWYSKADEAYKSWDKQAKFKEYMKKRLPHLADGEIDAIGRVLALKKTMQAEQNMSKMYASHFIKSKENKEIDKTSDIMMASEKDKKKE